MCSLENRAFSAKSSYSKFGNKLIKIIVEKASKPFSKGKKFIYLYVIKILKNPIKTLNYAESGGNYGTEADVAMGATNKSKSKL